MSLSYKLKVIFPFILLILETVLSSLYSNYQGVIASVENLPATIITKNPGIALKETTENNQIETDRNAYKDPVSKRDSSENNTERLREKESFKWIFNKKVLHMIAVISAIVLLILAYKVRITLDIYEFYNTDEEGIITFRDYKDYKRHRFKHALADVMSGLGYILAFIGLYLFIW